MVCARKDMFMPQNGKSSAVQSNQPNNRGQGHEQQTNRHPPADTYAHSLPSLGPVCHTHTHTRSRAP